MTTAKYYNPNASEFVSLLGSANMVLVFSKNGLLSKSIDYY